MKSSNQIKIQYEEAINNCLRNNVEEAIRLFIQEEHGYFMSIFPQALNPFLRALESMGAWQKALVVPYHDKKNKPIYIIMKIGDSVIDSIILEKGEEQ